MLDVRIVVEDNVVVTTVLVDCVVVTWLVVVEDWVVEEVVGGCEGGLQSNCMLLIPKPQPPSLPF